MSEIVVDGALPPGFAASPGNASVPRPVAPAATTALAPHHLDPGRYVWICPIEDADGAGREMRSLGMVSMSRYGRRRPKPPACASW